MKISLVHPYRHHAYNSCIAISKVNPEFEAIFGFYNKNSELRKLFLSKTIYLKSKGYVDERISDYVNTSFIASLLFLYAKLDKKHINLYRRYFEKYALKRLNMTDVVYVLQDYCQEVIDYSVTEGKLLIYDHIMPCGYLQRNLLIDECNYLNYDTSFVEEIFPIDKIEQNYENIRNAALVINASQSTFSIAGEALRNESKTSKNIVIPYGSNFSYFSDDDYAVFTEKKFSNINNRKLKILYVGSLSLMKGTHYLIKTIEETQNREIEYGIVGLPNREEDKAFLNRLLEFNNVKFYGHIPHKEMYKIYLKYDVFLFTSLVEGFGMVTLEAMSFGLPCIVNQYCSSIVKDKYDGFIVEARSEESIIECLDFLLNNRNLLSEYSGNSYQTSKKYSWEKYINKLSKEINILCSNFKLV